jgi:hypothetical protein
MTHPEEYPQSVEEVICDVKYPGAVLRAVRQFKEMKPWRGSGIERAAKFMWLNEQLCSIYGVDIKLSFDPLILVDNETPSGNGFCYMDQGIIELVGKLSVITFLHEWGHVLKGWSEYEACKWSINLFRRVFPVQYSRLNTDGHILRSAS